MRNLIYLFLFIWAFSFVSCDKDEVDNSNSKRYLGYFKGDINGETIINNNLYRESKRFGNIWYENGKQYFMYTFGIPCSNYGLGITIPVKEGLIELREVDEYVDKDTLGYIYLRNLSIESDIIYQPLNASFKIYIDSVRYHSEWSGLPFIEGKMEGILYNEHDSKDSIIIKNAIFGIN